METNVTNRANSKGKKENPIELIETQVLNGQIITLREIAKDNGYSLKTGIKAFLYGNKALNLKEV